MLAGGVRCVSDDSDGKTPMHTLHGRRDNTPILEFGEKVLYKLARPARGGTWDPRFYPGVFVEMLNSSSDAVVVTDQGSAIKTRASGESLSRKDGMRIECSECEQSRGLQTAVSRNGEAR